MPTTSPPVYNGRYELSHQIARGGTAQVYLARDLLLDRPVALKMLFPELSTDRSFVDRFRREAQAAANLSHPNIVPVFDWGESDRTYYIVMEYVDGEPLSALIRTQAPLDGAQSASIGADIAKALSYAHRHGVVHRDIKPGNVLITSDGQVKVGDFGIARAIGSDENVTQTGLVMGTATYFSPEQAQGLTVDGRSDVYSLGVVLFEMLTGRPPFSGETPVSIAYQHVREPAPTPRSVNPSIPLTLEAIVLQAMAKQPSERYQTAQDLQADLQRWAQGGSVLVPPADLGVAARGAPGAGNGAVGLVADTPSGAAGATTVMPADRGAATTVMGAATTTTAAGVATRAAVAATAAGALTGGVAGTAPVTGATSTTTSVTTGSHRVDGKPPLPKTHTLAWAVAAVALMAAMAGVVFFGGRALGYFGGKPWFGAPNLVGMTQTVASQKMQQDGLVLGTVTPQFSSQPSGNVLAQTPLEGSSVRAGYTVSLTVSKGPASYKVLSVMGLSDTTATQDLESQGFKVTAVFEVQPVTDNYNQGVVFAQSPAAGQTLQAGQTVTIDVVRGEATIPVPTVPANSTPEAATQFLLKHQFGVASTVVTQYSNTVPNGDVITTQPAPGTPEQEGFLVTLVVSQGVQPPEITVPIVNSDTPSQAENALTSRGFQWTLVNTTVCQQSQNGLVQETDPLGGNTAQQGSTVKIVVGQYDPTSPACGTTTTSTTSTTTATTGTGNTGTG